MTMYATNNLKLGAYLLTFGAKHHGCEIRDDPYFSCGRSVWHTYSHPDMERLVRDYREEPFVRHYKKLKMMSEEKLSSIGDK